MHLAKNPSQYKMQSPSAEGNWDHFAETIIGPLDSKEN